MSNFTSPRWTAADLARLDREYATDDLEQLAESMGRSPMAIMKRASERGLRRVSEEERVADALTSLFRDWAPAYGTPGVRLVGRV